MFYECPICKNDHFYERKVGEIDGNNVPTFLIKPRVRFSFFRGSSFNLPTKGLACKNCGSIWAQFYPQDLQHKQRKNEV